MSEQTMKIEVEINNEYQPLIDDFIKKGYVNKNKNNSYTITKKGYRAIHCLFPFRRYSQ